MVYYFIHLKKISTMNIINKKIRGFGAEIPHKSLKICFGASVLGIFLTLTGISQATVSVWQYQVLFNEFAGQPGGFEDQGVGAFVYNKKGVTSAPNTRNYDFVAPAGQSASGKTIYGIGQDSVTDLSVTSQIIDGSNGHWTNILADKTVEGLRASAFVSTGKSTPGDYAVVAYTFSFNTDLGITAKDLAVRLSNVNGIGEIYEWSFVTLGSVEDAPFTVGDISNYKNTDYTNVGSGVFYNADGTPSGAAATNQPLQDGKSMSQYLAGQPGASPGGGVVAPGWFANDDFHVNFQDGPEANFTNPTPGSPDSSKPDTLSVRGVEELGLDELANVSSFTVWLGYNDVGFDSNLDGFTSTGSTQRGMISFVNIGVTEPGGVPEPSTSVLLGLLSLGVLTRRRR
jgi:hypothetical protein